ncbi:MAG: hypothetical protein COU90_03520, partial [Candidatus Ryanbacteria bacterium CG10_big_fil_rev_8_21_14_0_10_43_42]
MPDYIHLYTRRRTIALFLSLSIFLSQTVPIAYAQSEEGFLINKELSFVLEPDISTTLVPPTAETIPLFEEDTSLKNQSTSDDTVPADTPLKQPEDTPVPEQSAETEGVSALAASGSGLDALDTLFAAGNGVIASLNIDVDEASGALSYTYPLAVPPGRNDLAPNMALFYNSNEKDNLSPVGYGWSLSVPSIERINRHGTEELYVHRDFRSSFDGELREISPAGGSPLAGGSFGARTETGAFRTYEFTGTNWIMRDKNGTAYTFGGNPQSRIENGDNVHTWFLDRMEDTNGNYISYEYVNHGGILYPSRIQYTNHSSGPGIFEILFTLEDRPDIISSWHTGFELVSQKRIGKITMRALEATVREYAFVYTAGDNGVRSLLSSITETGYSETGESITLPATTFSYQEAVIGFTYNPEFSGFNGRFSNQRGAHRFTDLNGDGLTDALEYYQCGSGCSDTKNAAFNTGAYWAEQPSIASNLTTPFLAKNANGDKQSRGVEFLDVDADSVPELVQAFFPATNIDPTYQIQTLLPDNTWTGKTGWVLPEEPLVYFTNEDGSSRLLDLNGDGLPDFYKAMQGSVYGGIKALLHNGAGWTEKGAWSTSNAPFMVDSTVQFGRDAFNRLVDVNADGITDAISLPTETTNRRVLINTGGNGWITDENITYRIPDEFVADLTLVTKGGISAENIPDNGVRFFDINDDGITDMVIARRTSDGITSWEEHKVYLGTGRGWQEDPRWTSFPITFNSTDAFLVDNGIRLIDLNGDGAVDWLQTITGASPAYLSENKPTDVLIGISNTDGGSSSFTYAMTTELRDDAGALTNPNLHTPLQIARTITTNDGFGATAITEYAYASGEHYYANAHDRKFAGFHTVTETDADGNTTTTYFHQANETDSANGESADHYAKIGRAYRIERANSSGDQYQTSISRWNTSDLGDGRTFVFLEESIQQLYNGTASHKDTAVTYAYDVNGNIATETKWGEVIATGDGSFTDVGIDKRTTARTYAADAGSAIRDRETTALLTDQGGSKLSESRFFYDTLPLGQVSTGNRTKEEVWINTGNSYAPTTRAFNAFGMPLTETDPRGNTTSFTYDTHNLYPVTITNPLEHQTTFTYDYRTGNTLRQTDPNGFVAETTYDALGRPAAKKQTAQNGITLSIAETYTYNDTLFPRSTAQTTYLSQTAVPKQTIVYRDGLSRNIQTRETTDAGTYAVRTTVYDALGRIAYEYAPIESTNAAYAQIPQPASQRTSLTYDAMGRVTAQTTPLGTTTTTRNDWLKTITNPRGNMRTFTYDAYKNLIGVNEYNSADIYTTTYTYDALDRLTSITDAEGNIRTFTHDSRSLPLTVELPHTPAEPASLYTYAYDIAGNLIRQVDPNGTELVWTHDTLNRPLGVNAPATPEMEGEFIYDSAPNGIGRIVTETTPNYTISYEYDIQGNIVKETRTLAEARGGPSGSGTENPPPPPPPVPAPSESFFDDFESGLGNWIESNEFDWTVEAPTERSVPGEPSGNMVAHADNCDSFCVLTLAEPLDIANAAMPTLSFWRYADAGLDWNEYLRVEIFDGSSWQEVFYWTNNAGDTNEWEEEMLDLTPYKNANFSIRFTTKESAAIEEVEIDNVRIEDSAPVAYTTPAVPSFFAAFSQSLRSFLLPKNAHAQTSSAVIYGDSLASGWEAMTNSLAATITTTESSTVFSGMYSIKAVYNTAKRIAYLRNIGGSSLDGYDTLSFAYNPGSFTNPPVHQIRLKDNKNNNLTAFLPLTNYLSGTLQPNTWYNITIPLSDLNAVGAIITRIDFRSVSRLTTLYLDQIEFRNGTPPATNQAPIADAGADQTIALPESVSLSGSASDDGLPSGALTTMWTKISGPGTVTFGDASALSTTASFSTDGVYALSLTADDTNLQAVDTVTITVNPETIPAPPPSSEYTDGIFITTYDYDDMGALTALTDPSGTTTTYTYSPIGSVHTVQKNGELLTTHAYTHTGAPASVAYANGTASTYTYDADKLYLLSGKITTFGGASLQDISYAYDANGNITRVTDTGTELPSDTTYAYDALDRLIRADLTIGTTTETYMYAYSPTGNIQEKTEGGATTAYTYTDSRHPHASTSAGSDTFAYDANGNLVSEERAGEPFEY